MRRVALVTGGAQGIGRAIARRLHEAGHAVVVVDIAELPSRDHGDFERHIVGDVSDPEDVRRTFDEVASVYSRLDVLVNNAALTDVHRPWDSVSVEDWDRVLAVNLRSAFLCARHAAVPMKRQGYGRIVNISSVTALTGQRDLIDYVSAKAGLIGLTRSLARELGGDGITVNSVSPGAIRTDSELAQFPDQEAVMRQQLSRQAIPRRGEPEDIGSAVAFLAGEEAGFITGQLLNVDGGWHMH